MMSIHNLDKDDPQQNFTKDADTKEKELHILRNQFIHNNLEKFHGKKY